MLSRAIEDEYRGMVEAYGKAGGNKDALSDSKTGRLVIHENKVLNTGEVDGVIIETTPTESGVKVTLTIEEGKKIEKPVHLCFGMLPKDGLQEIDFHVDSRKGSEVKVLAHCIFPNAVKVIHKMDADIVIGENASFDYRETHYHGEGGGVELLPKGKVTIQKGGSFYSTFAISDGRVGRMDYDFDVYCLENSVAELVVKAYGRGDDEIKIAERVYLNGTGARGMAKSRLVLSDRAKAEVRGETYGNAADSRGHIDCMELVNGDKAVATAIPIVSVTNDKAKVTHEAAIGSVDKKQVETLMARGLDEDKAVDVIVKGILK